MKRIIPYLIIALILFGAFRLFWPHESGEEKLLREDLAEITERLNGRLSEIRNYKSTISKQRSEKSDLKKEIREMIDNPLIKIKKITEIKTVTELKTEYVKIYDFLEELKPKLRLLLKVDDEMDWTVENIIKEIECLVEDAGKKEKIKSKLDRLKYRRSWSLIGAYDSKIKGPYVKIRKYVISSARLDIFIDGKYEDPFGDSGKLGLEAGIEIKLK